MSTMEQIQLTPEQAQFAYEHDAGSYVRCANDYAVCMYNENERRTIRWIVDHYGLVLESTAFDAFNV
jgi:hypothetical protein